MTNNSDIVSAGAAELIDNQHSVHLLTPNVLLTAPRSPTFSSTLLTTVPSGTVPRGRMLPTVKVAFFPA
jgi:hypothetical protein